eukprot:TRINITY_DN4259_c0_g1_i1.p1 TRINITY_DN4259_c0_g1~~TRINITY_DN4259_c0_g1_i1.p1  ORF type:complete len:159 (-),score=23.19 TRINITY_DN4259_c0_g1_i1:134-610(-)
MEETGKSGAEKITLLWKSLKDTRGLPEFISNFSVTNAYESLVINGIQIKHLENGHLLCEFKVPPRLVDENGQWRSPAIMSLLDNICGSCIISCNLPLKVSVDFNVSYIDTAKIHDEMEIEAKVVAHKGDLSFVTVDVRNKSTGQLIVNPCIQRTLRAN